MVSAALKSIRKNAKVTSTASLRFLQSNHLRSRIDELTLLLRKRDMQVAALLKVRYCMHRADADTEDHPGCLRSDEADALWSF